MAFTLALPSIASALRSFYPMKIYESGRVINMLPCDIMDLQIHEQTEIPNMPIDKGGLISDTLYRMPLHITAQVYVNALDYDIFISKLESLQYGNGFEISGVDNQIYKNLRLTDRTEPQTADVSGAYFITLGFRETIIIESFNSAIPYTAKKKAGYSSGVNKGTSGSKETKRSTLKTLSNKFLG